MKSTAMPARQFRFQEWAEQIKHCNNRSHGMTAEEWCELNGITKANYYYLLKRVRRVYLQRMLAAEAETTIIPMPIAAISTAATAAFLLESFSPDSLKISSRGFSLTVTNSTLMELLGKILKVIADA